MIEKNQPPTAKRLRDARKKGDIARSTELVDALVFIATIAALATQAPNFIALMRDLFDAVFEAVASRDPAAAVHAVLTRAMRAWLMVGIGIVAVGGVVAAAVALAQTGGLVAFERIMPSLDKLNPAGGMKQMFSMRSLINLVKMTVKTTCLAGTIWALIRSSLDAPLQAGYLTPAGMLAVTGRMLSLLLGWAAIVFICFAVIDYVHQQYEYMKKLRMSTEEVRREYREMNGNPQIASKRKRMAREQVFDAMQDRVKGASAVVHSSRVAVALQYTRGSVPWVSLRAEGETALRIVELSREFLIPTVNDPSLAEALFDGVPEGKYIDESLFERVAKLLRWARGQEETQAP